MQPKRIAKIDFLRGLSIIIMIFLHTSADVIHGEKITYFLWDYLHMAVPLFIFCSGYVLVKRYAHVLSKEEFFKFYKKRVLRLLIPYYLFLPFYFLILFLQKNLSLHTIWSSVLLWGGPNINWLILLFLEVTLLFPILLYLKKYKYGIISLFFISMTSSILLNFWQPPHTDYRFYMVLPWLMPFLVPFFYETLEKRRKLHIVLIVSFFLVFLIQRYLFIQMHHTLVLQWNKFPPNFYYLSYDMFWLFALDYIGRAHFFENKFVFGFFHFFSKYSYSIFFIHFLIIEFIYRIYYHTSIDKVPLSTYQFFAIVTISTVIIQLLWNISSKQFLAKSRNL